ncbi:hypothetical protein QCA50_000104 [Cerrena zonata]|uniref:Uncharacterized protein n=1 Tax=Cerrena zonata TaxID=2478898 RepID=A0AAW0GPY8_9APHY
MGPGHKGAIGKETDEPEAQEMPSERKQNPDLVLSRGVGNERHSYPGSLLGLAVGTLRVLEVGTMGILEVSRGWLAHIVEGSMVLKAGGGSSRERWGEHEAGLARDL